MPISDEDHAREFAIRLYRWALDEWRFEVAGRLPVFQSMGESEPATVLVRMAPDRCLAVGLALARQSKGAKLLGEAAPAEDEALLYWYRGEILAERWAASYDERKVKLSAAATKSLREKVQKALTSVLGKDRERVAIGEWCYSTPVGKWWVETTVRVHPGPEAHLTYWQDLSTDGFAARLLSYQRCLGLFPAMRWGLRSEEEIPAAGAGLAEACGRLLAATPPVLW